LQALRIAYFTNQYPSVSHTFIRREIRALEALGLSILRIALRPGAHVDPEDAEEAKKTWFILRESKWWLLLEAKLHAFTNPAGAARALAAAFTMARRSDRGYLRHCAYLIEAAVLYRHLRRARIDHLHVHFGTNAAAVARLARIMGGPPYSMTVHGPDEFDAPIGLSLREKMQDAAFTVAISDYGASQLRRWVPYPVWDRIHVVHCTVAAPFFEQAAPVREEADSIVCVGRLSAQKGHLLLLQAFESLVGGGVPGKLVLVGDGELRGALEAHIESAGLGDRVLITGWQTEAEVREHLLRARALVLASFAEGLPVVIMEAMALQRPVVATAIAGIPELVRDGREGWLVTPGNSAQMAAALREALTLPVERLREMGTSGAARARARHTVETEVPKLEQLIQAQLPPPVL
jgi:colanic acid/amylovoran biosynthesis glycosyltransferase